MDVKSFSSGRTPSQELCIMNSNLSGPTPKKKQNFIIQESITINKGKITSSYLANTKNVNTSANVNSHQSQIIMKDKNLLQGLKDSLSRKISKTNKSNIMTTVIANKVNMNKKLEVPSTSCKSNSTEIYWNMNPINYAAMETDIHSPDVDFEDVIPTTATNKNTPALAISSAVSFFPAVNNIQKLPTKDSITVVQKTMQNSPSINISVRKRTKKKKRRFRNMDGSEDEDDWPTSVITNTSKVNPTNKTISTFPSTSYVTPTTSPMTSTTPKRKEKIQILQEYIFPSPHSQIRTPKKVDNVERVDRFVEKIEKLGKCNQDRDDGHLSDDSVSSIHSKMSAISDFNLNGSVNMNDSLGEENLSAQNALEINEGVDDQENFVFQITEDGDEVDPQPGEIFCAYDDEGNLICLQKTETGELIMIPAETIIEKENTDETPLMNPADAVNLNNNSFEVESKEDLQIQQERIIKVAEMDKLDKLEEELFQSSESNSVKAPNVIDEPLLLSEEVSKRRPEDVSAQASVKDVIPRENDDSPGILVDTVENVGNEEIISESRTPPEEDVVTLPSPNQASEANEPLYILNEAEQQEVTSIHNATPLELAFITTLQSFAESATILPDNTRRGKAKTKTSKGKKAGRIIEPARALIEPQGEVILDQLETLLKKQNQCSIVDYVPADKSDEEQLDDSMNSVDNLSQMDIAKMVLGEGFSVRLVSDQAEAVDLLQLPPEYEQKPLVSVSIAPLIHSEDDATETDEKKSRAASPLKQKRPYNKKVNATSTPMAKSPKKKTYTIKHVTGDCNEGREVELHKVDKPAKNAKGKKHLFGIGKGKVVGSPRKKIKTIKKQRLNGSSTQNSIALSESLDPQSLIDDKLSATSRDGETSQADADSTDQSQTSILSPITLGGGVKMKKRKKKKRTRGKKIDKKLDDNNSSKENDSSVNDSASQLEDSAEDINASLTDVEVKRENIFSEESINSKDDSHNEDISLGSTSALSSEESDNFKIKIKPRTKKQKIVTPMVEARTTRSTTRSTLPKSISQSDLVNAEVSISLTEGYAKKEEVDEDVVLIDKPTEAPIDVDAHVEKVPTTDIFNDLESSANKSPAASNGDDSNFTNENLLDTNDRSVKSTPKSSKKLPFKINFKTLMNNASPANKKHKHKKSPKNKTKDKDRRKVSDVQFDADIKIKDEPFDDDIGAQPKVPKIILKISPHMSPSIVRSPSSSPQKSAKIQLDKMDTPQNKNKKEMKKRKVFSPVVSSETDSPKRKKKKTNEMENGQDFNKTKEDFNKFQEDLHIFKEDLNKSIPQATDDPELLINLPEALEDDLNTEVKVEVKKENENEPPGPNPYKVGDLVLARFSNYCYWPCMVTLEPVKQAYWRPSYSVVAYHVRFFGDNGRRAWVHGTNIIPCLGGLETLENHAKVLQEKKKFANTELKNKLNKDIAACKVNNRIRSSWHRGMCELMSLVNNTVAERHEFFFEMFATSKEKKRKRQITESEDKSPDIKQEIGSIEVKEEPLDKPAVKKRKFDKKLATPKAVEKVKKPEGLAAAKLGDRRRSVRSNKSTPSSSSNMKLAESPKEKEKDSNINNEKKNYVIEDLELIIKGSLETQGDDGIKQNREGEVADETKDEEVGKRTRNWRTKKMAEESKKIEKGDTNDKNKPSGDGASEISDTDSSSKVSVQSSGHKRVLFKDVSRSPVCHVCFNAGGTVVKCKGKCFGFYHSECSQLKAEPKNEEEHSPVFASPSVTKSPKTPQNSPPNVEIVSHKKKAKYIEKNEVNLNDSDIAPHLTLMDQLDNKLGKVMEPIVASTIYHGSTTDDATSEDDVQIYDVDEINENKPAAQNLTDFMCISCKHNIEPLCFACGSTVFLKEHVERYRCSINGCGKAFHKECLAGWPQSVISNDESFRFKCPMHACQTCTSENPKASTSLLPMSKMVRCLKCPATYDINSFCIPAGTEILSHSQIICPRHVQHKSVKRYTINANWCFICSRGGELMCCETCPTSVHSECISINLRPDDTFVCEDCESGRLPLYDEIVWAKFAHYKWWPAVILFPEDIPENVRNFPHKTGEFVVRFYGTHDHHWFALGRVFLFQEDDKGDGDTTPANKRDFNFQKAVAEAKTALIFKKQLKLQRDLARRKLEKPPPFTKIRINRVVGNLKPSDMNISNTNACNCREDMLYPCGPDSDCLNRLLLTECDPDVCPSKDKCQNQRFEKRIYPPLVAYKTDSRGWGLKSTEPIFKGQFVIEYVGEVIDQEEYQRRMTKMNQQKAENYYFLSLDGNRTIDAGPKGNLARFMNHCCKPNCETQKWTVKGDTRVGLFASQNIPAHTELTFNYHMETIGDRKEVCRCAAENCSGFLGVKNKEAVKPTKLVTKIKKKTKKISTFKKMETFAMETKVVPCFICEEGDADVKCTMKNCGKVYHVKCLDIVTPPQGKWTCPRHYCNTCAKRTIRSCYKCLESYCPMHSQGNINFHKATNYYVCNKHNPDVTSPIVSTSDSVSTTTTSSSHAKLDAS